MYLLMVVSWIERSCCWLIEGREMVEGDGCDGMRAGWMAVSYGFSRWLARRL
jgi:hypothetical protein